MNHDTTELYLARICHCVGDPAQGLPISLEYFPDGYLAINGHGGIVSFGAASSIIDNKTYSSARVIDLKDKLLVPGFVDAHIHFPQMDILASYGEDLLAWLNKYTYPVEQAYSNESFAEESAVRFFAELLAHGTTTAAIFSSCHYPATDALFRQALDLGMHCVIGKLSMDRNVPEPLITSAEQDLSLSESLIEKWHGKLDRLFYAVTPRFAPSCTDRLLKALGELTRSDPSLYVQTHLNELPSEIDWVRRLFPSDEDYLGVYERYGLVTRNTLLAHSIYSQPRELERMKELQCSVIHCPTSNTFLGSGLFPYHRHQQYQIRLGIGSDVGGGTSFSMWRTMAKAYEVQRLLGNNISVAELFYMATLGGAKALGLDRKIGNFFPGKSADFQVLDLSKSRLLARRFASKPTSTDNNDSYAEIFALMFLGDDRLVDGVYIGGKKRYTSY